MGAGETSRNLCYLGNAVQADLLAATAGGSGIEGHQPVLSQVFNVAVGDQTSLNELYLSLRESLVTENGNFNISGQVHRDFHVGDVRHSKADISKINNQLKYEPNHRVAEGISEAMGWYFGFLSTSSAQ